MNAQGILCLQCILLQRLCVLLMGKLEEKQSLMLAQKEGHSSGLDWSTL